MLGRRRRRRANIEPAKDQRLAFAGAVQSQKAVSAYFTGEQILPFGVDEQRRPHSRRLATHSFTEFFRGHGHLILHFIANRLFQLELNYQC